MPYWIAYRVGSFPLKEQFDSCDEAQDRASLLSRSRYHSILVRPDENDQRAATLLANSIEVSPGLFMDLCI